MLWGGRRDVRLVATREQIDYLKQSFKDNKEAKSCVGAAESLLQPKDDDDLPSRMYRIPEVGLSVFFAPEVNANTLRLAVSAFRIPTNLLATVPFRRNRPSHLSKGRQIHPCSSSTARRGLLLSSRTAHQDGGLEPNRCVFCFLLADSQLTPSKPAEHIQQFPSSPIVTLARAPPPPIWSSPVPGSTPPSTENFDMGQFLAKARDGLSPDGCLGSQKPLSFPGVIRRSSRKRTRTTGTLLRPLPVRLTLTSLQPPPASHGPLLRTRRRRD